MSTQVPIEMVFDQLKAALKQQGLTYADLAKRLRMSESGVKKLFIARDCSYSRLASICEALGLSLADIIDAARSSEIKEVRFTEEQENYFIKNPNCFKFFWKLVYEMRSAEEIQTEFKLSSKQVLKYLRTLDRFNLIELHPGNRVKVPPMDMVKWVGNGPLLRWIKAEWPKQILHEVTRKETLGEHEHYSLRYYQVTPEAAAELVKRVQGLDREFAQRSLREMTLNNKKRVLMRMVTAIAPGSYVRNIESES